MSNQVIEVQVQGDFIEGLTSARPVQALAELVWNALDSDATKVMVDVEQSTLGLEAITVTDDGDGIPYADAPVLFGNLGGSWKRLSRRSKSKKRILHGEEGKGRFRALALGRVVDWIVTTPLAGRLQRFTISILRDNPRRVTIGDSGPAPAGAAKGVTVRITEPQRQWRLDQNAVNRNSRRFSLSTSRTIPTRR
jgi:Histidine kinase-, DNA gyrase B-, and HSP90-like ATPase